MHISTKVASHLPITTERSNILLQIAAVLICIAETFGKKFDSFIMIRHRIGENVIPKKLQVTALHGGIDIGPASDVLNGGSL